ncbi:MAG: PDZ domain-containing protein [Gemmatimonadetes bacterium]|nr:PDZ domain-containing protein [Gemmatimonadota bacterium]MCB9504601.1 PDZ domain-containing protein [Gemmatimonadales bacterium]MCA9763399.1 PDZ domain-containing protein [Gemmatimonadota bacterium]MCA9768044.1 PDZ domain-containing protein [Gemmatimonadota bacterium]HPF60679.1 PDZ domain-containing protein [Gemmatimonadales bacterium]
MRSLAPALVLLLAPLATAAGQSPQLDVGELLDGPRLPLLGVGINCAECTLNNPHYVFGRPWEVASVSEGGVAARAGLMVGDTVLAIDGKDITSPEGWAKFATRTPGSSQAWLVIRAGRRETVTVSFPKP